MGGRPRIDGRRLGRASRILWGPSSTVLTAGRRRGGWRWWRKGEIAVGGGSAVAGGGVGGNGELQFGGDGEDRLTMDTRCYGDGYFG